MHTVIAITGASAGIGRATALRLARQGASVVICARRRDRLDELSHEIASAGGTPLVHVADVTDAEGMHALVRESVRAFGRLDVMMCN
ncbi:MAG: SDR family NAD(P)-dependent oxidoreductase, partial [Vicinamibacterales bacterium]